MELCVVLIYVLAFTLGVLISNGVGNPIIYSKHQALFVNLKSKYPEISGELDRGSH